MGSAPINKLDGYLGVICYSVATVSRGHMEKKKYATETPQDLDSKDRILGKQA